MKLKIKSIIALALISTINLRAYSAPEIKIYPESVKQGEQIFIELDTNESEQKLANLVVEINDKYFPLINIDNHYKCFVAISPELKVGEYQVKILNQQKETIASKIINVKLTKTGSQNISYSNPTLTKDQKEIVKKEDELVEKAKITFSEKQLWNKPFILPVPHKVTALYGIKRYLNGKYNGYHTGVDFASPMGYAIKAINNGNIILAKYFSKQNSNGNLIYIDHGIGVGSVYLHLSKIIVKQGDYVKQGQIIGYIGSSGRSTGPHIHWCVYLNGQNTDGLGWTKLTNKLF